MCVIFSDKSEDWLQGYNDAIEMRMSYCSWEIIPDDYKSGWNRACEDFPNCDRRKL